MRVRFKEIFDTAPDLTTAAEAVGRTPRAKDRIARLDFGKFWTTYDNWKDGNLELLWRALHQRGGGRDQQQGPSDYQAVLRREVVGHALEPADPGPEPGVGGGGADHRRATRRSSAA